MASVLPVLKFILVDAQEVLERVRRQYLQILWKLCDLEYSSADVEAEIGSPITSPCVEINAHRRYPR